MSRRLTAVLLLSSLWVYACSGDDDTASSVTFAPPLTNRSLPAMTTTTAESVTTTTEESTTTITASTLDSVTDPSIANSSPTTPESSAAAPTTTIATGEADWLKIVSDLSVVYDELQRDPVIERIGEYCAPGDNPCQETLGGTIRFLAEQGYRVEGLPLAPIESAQLTATPDDAPAAEAEFVVVSVTSGEIDSTGARVVDGDGAVVFELDPEADAVAAHSNWILTPLPGGAWRVLDIMDINR